jgi:hypothetical protein
MKISSVFLAGSLAANVALVAVFIAGTTQHPEPAVVRAAPVPSSPRPSDAAAIAAESWKELQSDDLRAQAEKLRADGFPPSMIRAIVGAQIHASFAARRKALENAQADRPFWKSTADPASQAALRALWREEQKAIKDVLGPDPENSITANLHRQFPQFPADTIDQIAAIRERYDQQRADIYSNFRGGLLPDEQAKVDALEKAMRADMAAVLTPQQLEDYELRTSNTANQLRYSLTAFNATEQEFRTLYSLQKAFDDQWGMMRGGMSEDQQRARNEAQKQLTEQIKGALGADRYADYQRATDYNYRQTTQLVARLNLPPETANSLYAAQKEFEQRRNDMYRNSAGAGAAAFENVAEQAKNLQQEAIARVTQILGDATRVNDYKQYGGSWIQNMIPRSPGTKK